jgi:hypothetical protein
LNANNLGVDQPLDHLTHGHPSLQSLCPASTTLTMEFLPGGVAMTPMSDLLQLPQRERLALAIALWDSLDDQARDGALSVDPALCAELGLG